MTQHTTFNAIPTNAIKAEALTSMSASFERFCLAAGLEALTEMLEADAVSACGPRHGRGRSRQAHRWGKTKGKIGFHGGKVELERPRLRGFDGKEQALPSWEAAQSEDWLGRWAMNQMLINVSTRKFQRSMRLPEGGVPAQKGSGLSKSAASRHFVALSAARLKEWMASDLSGLDLLVIQIDGIHMDEDMTLVAALGVDATGDKHPLGLAEGATENAATVQALIDNLVERGLDPAVPRLFIIDGSKALSKAIRATFGRDVAIQRCQIHKARNIMDRLPKSMHAQVRRVLRQAWEMDDALKAEQLLRNLARRLEKDWEGVSASILEGLDEMLTVTRLGLPAELRRSLACTNIIENVMGTVRRVCRNVKYWRSPSMALRWAGAAMQEAAKGFRRLKAHKQLPLLKAALAVRKAKTASSNEHLDQTAKAAIMDGLFYVPRSGLPWRMQPRDFPPVTTVQRYFYAWRDTGLWSTINHLLLMAVRLGPGREASPSAGVIDSQSVKTTESGGPRGYDAGKKLKGRKRHILTDTLGLLVAAAVHTADIQDGDGAPRVLTSIRARFPWLRHLFADGGNAGEKLEDKSPYRYHAIASNRADEDAAATMEWYSKRGDASENRIKDLKIGFGMEYMPCGSFQANAVFFAIGALTYNLYLGFRSQALGSGWERSQVQTVRWRLFQTAGKIVRHGRQMLLKISAAMLDMFAAIREHCARIMREGGAIPETS